MLLLTLQLALLPLAFSLPPPYYNYDIPFKQDEWQITPFHPDFRSPWSTVYQKTPVFEAFDGYYYQMPSDTEAYTEYPESPDDDIRSNEVVISPEEDIVGDTEVAKTHRQKRSPFFFGGYPSSSHAYSNSGASSFSGFGSSFSNTFGNSGASSTGGGLAFGSSNSNALGASFGGFSGPSFSGSNSNTNAFAFSRPSYNPWSFFGFRGR